jgi:hypothetical protein
MSTVYHIISFTLNIDVVCLIYGSQFKGIEDLFVLQVHACYVQNILTSKNIRTLSLSCNYRQNHSELLTRHNEHEICV